MKFVAPGRMNFMLFPGGSRLGRNSNICHSMVLAADHLGRALLYDPESTSVRYMPNLAAPKFAAASITVGDEVYVLDTSTTYRKHQRHCFEVFVHDAADDEWHCHSLPPPPYVVHQPGAYRAVSYAVVGGGSSIWVSSSELEATYCFDTASGGAWTWAKAGDWAMPFHGPAHHVPEHGVWVGLSAGDGCYGDDDGSVCVADVTAEAADGDMVWRYPAPLRCENKVCYLVHLGGSRFCHVRFFEVRRSYDVKSRKYGVLTGIEVARCGDGEGGGGR